MKTRKATLKEIRANPKVSVLIIGAGINGIGTFRDLTMQGVDCLIVDREDFCSGASMASSHMLHGGIRYLENGEFRLVREALHERNNLLRNAPHLTKPLPTTIPIFKWFSGILNSPLKFFGLLNKPAERGAIIIKLGLLMYDFYVRGDSPMPAHRFDNHQAALKQWPALNPEVIFAATYYDGAMESPERLALEILLDGIQEGNHAQALNYASVVRSTGENIVLKDEISGDEFAVKPEVIINAAGPWIDLVNHEISQNTRFIGGTKGSHLIIEHPELRDAIKDHEIFFEYIDGRIVLIFPYPENKVMIGTTDLRIDDPDQAFCSEEEIEYILGMVPQIFPGLEVTQEQIVFQFSGVRPLPTAKGSTGQISRDHSIEILEKNNQRPWPILNLVGGKWTSYRAFSEQVTDKVLDLVGLQRKARTHQLPIGGGRDYPKDEQALKDWRNVLVERSGLTHDRIAVLTSRYGTRIEDYLLFLNNNKETLFTNLPGYSKEEVNFITKTELIIHLDDFLLRRTKIAWTNQASHASISELAGVIGVCLGWDEETQKTEMDRCIQILRKKHGVRI